MITALKVEKLLFWVFNRGPLRGWGTIVDTWNSVDVSGLVGEANETGDDYAFQLNGVQQAGALVPLVRYDKRFARAVGKWMLNVANATRLMYPGYLPSNLQDADTWSDANDPKGVMKRCVKNGRVQALSQQVMRRKEVGQQQTYPFTAHHRLAISDR